MADDKPDLSGYQITITEGLTGWSWQATDPHGETIPRPAGWAELALNRDTAEDTALAAIEKHANPKQPIDGNQLRNLVRNRPAKEQR
jgi:hypothetical protein